MQEQIQQFLITILSQAGISGINPLVSMSQTGEHGEFTTNVAMVVANKMGKSPMETAEYIKQQAINKEHQVTWLQKIEVINPGFVNIFVKRSFLVNQISRLLNHSGKIDISTKTTKYIIEYSSPNIAKPFTVGHLRSTIIGDALANLLEATGQKVYRDNHLGDWGTQFGKQIYAIKTWGDEAALENSKNPVKDLVALYVKFHEQAKENPDVDQGGRLWFKKLEQGDPEARRLWEKCLDWSWKEFNKIYSELGVKFTENEGRGYGEAYFENKMQAVIEELRSGGLLKTGEEGAQIVEFPPTTKLPPLMILKKDGATLYSTRDLATDKFRLEHYGKHITIINEVGAEQALYFRQLYTLEEMLGWFQAEQRVHIKHGHYRFEEGKMSTRKGNVIWLEDVLAEAKKRAAEITSITSDRRGISSLRVNTVEDKVHKDLSRSKDDANTDIAEIAIGAIKWNDLKRNSEQDIVFDWDDILSMRGNSGPYLQYTFVRCLGILGKVKSNNPALSRSSDISMVKHQRDKLLIDQHSWDDKFLDDLTSEEFELLRRLSFFEDIVKSAAISFAPHILCTYLFELAQYFNHFYQQTPVLTAENENKKEFRLLLVSVSALVVQKGLNILGIQTPEKM